uniref:Uncharacterized protein n=1 Tax=Arundo donax TaxID=35708 RepID=A0A0A9QF75_ARUDO
MVKYLLFYHLVVGLVETPANVTWFFCRECEASIPGYPGQGPGQLSRRSGSGRVKSEWPMDSS